MKFRQRQILLSLGLFCFGVVIFLHHRAPEDNTDALVESNRRDARAYFLPKAAVTLSREDPAPKPEKNEDAGVKKEAVKKEFVETSRRPSPGPVVWLNQTSSESDCPHLLRPDNVQESQLFQKVDGLSSMLEFSAFLDVEQRVMRVVGLSQSRGAAAFCLLWYHPQQGQPQLRLAQARFLTLPEHHGRKYTAHYMECPLPDVSTQPYAVSISLHDCRQQTPADVTRQPTNVLAVLKPPEKVQRNFTVCVTALNYRYSKAYELVEMIELNRLLGANMFTFYVNSVGNNVRKVLRWYEARGLVQLVAWDLPMVVDHWPPAKEQPEVHYFAQLASHNDCLNRHRGVSQYLVYQDLDEFIIPKQTTTWTQLLGQVEGPPKSVYLFRCVFFRKEWPSNSENYTGRAVADRFRSIVLSTDKREPTLYPFNHRAKYMVDPALVQIVGIHNVWRFRGKGGSQLSNVGEKLAVLHHYRSWENPHDAAKAVRDTDMYRFKDPLLQRLEERWSQLPSVPLDIPLSQYGQV